MQNTHGWYEPPFWNLKNEGFPQTDRHEPSGCYQAYSCKRRRTYAQRIGTTAPQRPSNCTCPKVCNGMNTLPLPQAFTAPSSGGSAWRAAPPSSRFAKCFDGIGLVVERRLRAGIRRGFPTDDDAAARTSATPSSINGTKRSKFSRSRAESYDQSRGLIQGGRKPWLRNWVPRLNDTAVWTTGLPH